MKNILIYTGIICFSILLSFSQCADKQKETTVDQSSSQKADFGGYESQEKWGEHLVTIASCHDCHTPKKMTDHGLVIDSSLLLSGHPAQMPPPDVDRKEIESKGLVVSNTLTAWVGPWGISYTANLTSDASGIGGWQETNFITAIREGKFKGISSARPLLPPMPWEMYRHMTDDELKAIFAYLKTTEPIRNIVPAPQPPLSARK